MGDGELQEGQIWEAALFAAHNKLNNLIALVDWNGKQIDGNNDDVISLGNLQQKWESFGWKVQIVDGHDFDAMHLSLGKLEFENNPSPPQIFLIKTTMGKGVDFMEDDHNWHGVAPNQDQCEKALAQLSSSLVDY